MLDNIYIIGPMGHSNSLKIVKYRDNETAKFHIAELN